LGVHVLHLASRRSRIAKILSLLSQEDVGHMSRRTSMSTVSRGFFIKIQFYIRSTTDNLKVDGENDLKEGREYSRAVDGRLAGVIVRERA